MAAFNWNWLMKVSYQFFGRRWCRTWALPELIQIAFQDIIERMYSIRTFGKFIVWTLNWLQNCWRSLINVNTWDLLGFVEGLLKVLPPFRRRRESLVKKLNKKVIILSGITFTKLDILIFGKFGLRAVGIIYLRKKWRETPELRLVLFSTN